MLKSHLSFKRIVSAGLILLIGVGLALALGEQDSRALSTLPEGRVQQVTGQPAGPNLIAVVDDHAANGTMALYRSQDGGESWLVAGTLPLTSVQALALSPVNVDILAAASASQIVYTADGGQTWHELTTDFAALNATDAQINALAIDGRNSQRLYVGTTQGLFEFDGGALVRSADDTLGSTAVTALLTPRDNLGAIYAGTPRGLYTDLGDGWVRVAGVAAPVSGLLESNGTLLAATGSNGLYRSIDGGRTWTVLPEQLGVQPGVTVDVTALSADLTRPGVLYAATAYWFGSTERHLTPGSIYISLDYGSRWEPMVDSDGQAIIAPARVNRLLPSTTQALHVQALTNGGSIEAQYGRAQDQLINLSSANPADRAWAAAALGWLGDTSAAPALVAHLDDPDAAVGLAVVHALGHLSDRRVVPDLVQRLHTADEAVAGIPGTVRMRAAMALGLLRAAEAVGPLANIMMSDQTIAQAAAADALARIGTPAAAEALARALAEDALSPTRQVAMRGLERMGSAAAPTLERLVRTDTSATTRRNAAELLGWIAAPGSTPSLVAALADRDVDVRVEVAWALGEIGSPAAHAALQATAQNDTDPAVRTAAALALSRQPVTAPVVAAASTDQTAVWTQLANLLAPPRGLILLFSALLAVLVLWLRPGASGTNHRMRHS